MSPTKMFFAAIVFVFSVGLAAHADQPKPEHVPTTRTPLTQVELLHALREGHRMVFGTYPSKNRLAMAWGQVAFENGGGKYSFNHNLGNVGASAADQPTYFNRGDHHWYRAFIDFDDGAAAYWSVIKRCWPALRAFDTGNPQVAVVALKNCNYFEASVAEYSPGFTSLFYTALSKIIPEVDRDEERRTQELLAAIRASITDAGPAPTATPDSGVGAIVFDDRD